MPHRAKIPRPPSRSRFQEGSMNDRTSATPPVHFIGPDERAILEKPLPALPFSMAQGKPRPVSYDPAIPLATSASAPTPVITKRGSKQFLGQMWDGVMGKLRMKKEAPVEDEVKRRKSEEKKSRKSKEDDRPSREEIFESYNNLVASGFFAAHAIQSTRQPGPGMSRPSTADQTSRQGSSERWQQQRPQQSQNPQRPKWPLSPLAATPPRIRPSSPSQTPASADSRGTKRAADEEPEEDPIQNIQRVRKLRKSASTTQELTVPKLRSSSRTILSSRSFSNARAAAAAQAEAVKSSKRAVMSKISGLQQHSMPVPDRNSSARRNASDTHGKTLSHKTSSRVLRPRRSAAEPLRVRPNTNRGVPKVPDIPSKFTYGQDRENDGPWRGLRRAHAGQE
ncbi:unnamed protein product [Clonostachys rosea]|uniref:DUF4045 domain-containing protein n=1 Tax=Bionectria ochroleuca TaxID=29856 RepID=A0ABY6UYT9_BIOOC|nr:unnamed protein product [Clonostachys rosea]